MNISSALQAARSQHPFPEEFVASDGRFETIASTVKGLVSSGSRVLDFGAGTCQVSAVLQNLGFACTCIDDLNDQWHMEGGNRSSILRFAADLGIDYVVSDGSEDVELPFDDATFDVAMLNDVIEHLHNSPRRLLNEVIRTIKPGGYLLITVPNAVNGRKRLAVLRGQTNHAPYSTYYWYPDPWRGHVREYTRGDLEQLVDFLGLDRADLRSFHGMLHRLPRRAHPPFKLLTKALPGLRDTWLLVGKKPIGWSPSLTPSN